MAEANLKRCEREVSEWEEIVVEDVRNKTQRHVNELTKPVFRCATIYRYSAYSFCLVFAKVVILQQKLILTPPLDKSMHYGG